GHKKSFFHASATEAADNSVAIKEGQKKDIVSTLSSSHNMPVEKNRQVLVSIVDAIVLCGKENIALSTDGATLIAAFLGNLRVLNIQLDKMRGQGCDGAANMSGRFDFIVILIAVEYSGVVPLSKILQKENAIMFRLPQLDTGRDNDGTWDNLFTRAVVLAQQVGVEPLIPRNALRQKTVLMPQQQPYQTSGDETYNPFVDHLITELRDHLLVPHGRLRAQYLIPNRLVSWIMRLCSKSLQSLRLISTATRINSATKFDVEKLDGQQCLRKMSQLT
ncbi:hypothetical protein MAR_019499, partial [Mya arenaria]